MVIHRARATGNVQSERGCRSQLIAEVEGDIKKMFHQWNRFGWHRVTVYGDIQEPLVELADGSQEALAAVVNLSAVGLLLETDAVLEPGQFVVFSIDVDPDQEPVSGKAEVVRKADPERDGVEGIGVRFISFEGDSRQRLEAILGRAFQLPIDEIRTTS